MSSIEKEFPRHLKVVDDFIYKIVDKKLENREKGIVSEDKDILGFTFFFFKFFFLNFFFLKIFFLFEDVLIESKNDDSFFFNGN